LYLLEQMTSSLPLKLWGAQRVAFLILLRASVDPTEARKSMADDPVINRRG
jgi:hypothetical protein